MAAAEVGDDVWGEDPTVNALEERAAELLGKEAGLFVSSGTMGNLVSLMAHLAARPRGDRRRPDPHRHRTRPAATRSSWGERDASSATGSTARSTRTRSRPRSATRPIRTSRSPPSSRSRTPTPLGRPAARRVAAPNGSRVARPAPGVPLHVDGARIFNAVGARSGPRPAELACCRPTRSAFCLSKGLSCPVGSVSSAPAVRRPGSPRAQAPRRRDAPGRGPRRGGAHCAPGRPTGMIARLAEDHANARRLAERLARSPAIRSPGDIARPDDKPLDPARWPTNFVLFRVARRSGGVPRSRSRGTRSVPWLESPHGSVRAATHYGIERRTIARPLVAAVAAPCAATTAAAAPGARTGRRTARPATHAEPTRSSNAARPDPAPRPPRGRSTSASTTSSMPASDGSSATTRLRDVSRHPHRGPPARRRDARRDPRQIAAETGPPRRSRGDRSGRPVGRRPLRARPRDPQHPGPSSTSTSMRTWERRSTALDASATRSSAVRPRRSPRSASGSTPSPAASRPAPAFLAASRDPGRRAPGPDVAGDRDRDAPATCRPSSPRSWPPGGGPHGAERRRLERRRTAARPRNRRLPAWLRDRLAGRTTTGRSGASATTSWSGCARSTASTPTRSSRSARSSSAAPRRAARVAAALEIDPTATRRRSIDRTKRTTRHVRGGARRLPRRHASGPGVTSSSTTS